MLLSRELRFVYDFGQLYLHDADRSWSEGYNEYLAALDDARAHDLSVGVSAGVVDLLMPRQDNFSTPLRVEVWETPPPLDEAGWDHVEEFPLAVPSGKLTLSASGGSGDVEVAIPAGTFRGGGHGLASKPQRRGTTRTTRPRTSR
jgi:hypothetical protein